MRDAYYCYQDAAPVKIDKIDLKQIVRERKNYSTRGGSENGSDSNHNKNLQSI
jgi:hypothetical protein